jgi:hypothetical protein
MTKVTKLYDYYLCVGQKQNLTSSFAWSYDQVVQGIHYKYSEKVIVRHIRILTLNYVRPSTYFKFKVDGSGCWVLSTSGNYCCIYLVIFLCTFPACIFYAMWACLVTHFWFLIRQILLIFSVRNNGWLYWLMNNSPQGVTYIWTSWLN